VHYFQADEAVVPPDSRVLAAVSSGADSMALLFWLHSLGRDLVVGHIHHDLHELRNGACDDDFEFVRAKCAEIEVPFVARKIELARKNGHVNEEIARLGRYFALGEMARENNCLLVATAHTATDGLETALLNLMRGAGPNGWLGIAPRRVLEAEIQLVRPFWRLPREATRQILRENNWNWREDASNLDPLFRRNRVRHEVLPLLSDISGQDFDDLAVRHARNAQIGRDEAAFLETLTAEALSKLRLQHRDDLVVLDGLKLRELDVALQRRVIRSAARLLMPDLRDLASEKVEVARLAVSFQFKRAVWTWRSDLRVEWTGASAGNRLRFWRVWS
jgi:tRNA(Ile)-lysidine synthase